jgi:ATP/maltotriose-dependent transcriptional regulator MalT
LYTAAEAHPRIERLLGRVGFDFFELGRRDLVDAALSVLPESMRRQNPRLLALRAAQAFAAGHYDRSDACYDEALRLALDKAVRGEIVHRYAQGAMLRAVWEKCITLIESYGLENVEDARLHARMLGTLASAYSHMPSKGDPLATINRAFALVATVDDEPLRATILHQIGFVAFVGGNYEQAESCASTVISLAEQHGLNGLAARAAAVLAAILEERGDTQRRLSVLQKMGTYAERSGDFQFALRIVAEAYIIEVERAEDERMKELEGKLSRFDTKGLSLVSQELLSSFALQVAWNGDFSAAFQMLEGSLEGQATGGHRALRWAEIALYATSAGEREVAESAVSHVFEELQGVESRGEPLTHYTLRARVWLILTYLLLGRSSSANNMLSQFERGKSKKLPPLIGLLLNVVRTIYVHLETGAEHDKMAQVLNELRHAGYTGYARLFDVLPVPNRSEASPFCALTKTELLILRALANGSSSRGIGEEMKRSALTIDTHVKSIVRKLGCKGRREAVSLARRHGII